MGGWVTWAQSIWYKDYYGLGRLSGRLGIYLWLSMGFRLVCWRMDSFDLIAMGEGMYIHNGLFGYCFFLLEASFRSGSGLCLKGCFLGSDFASMLCLVTGALAKNLPVFVLVPQMAMAFVLGVQVEGGRGLGRRW